MLAQTHRGRLLCRQCLARQPTGCPAGLRPLVLPVTVDGVTVARLLACPTPQKLAAHRAILKVLAEHIASLLRPQQPAEPDCVRRAKQIAHAHHAQPLSTRDVARQVNQSLQHFCRQFRKHTGQSFLDYLARVRVAKAKELLADRRLLMKQIAAQTGFGTVTHFNRVFKKVTGTNPTRYRQSGRSSNRFIVRSNR